jgi:phytoene synthase
MAAILGVPAESERLARLGVAFQLTNFLRDVREDYALDRIYLPADERERLGVRDEDLAAATATPALRRLIAAEVERARGLFAETTPALVAAIPSARRGIALARAVYVAVLDRIQRNDFDVLGRTTRPRPWQLARAVVQAL